MSIFSWIISIEQFFAKLLTGIKKDYLNLEPQVKSFIDSAITAGNVIKTYLSGNGANPVAQTLVTLLEDSLGTGLVSAISDILSEVLIDCGIIATSLTDPELAWQTLLNHLRTFTGTAFGKELFKIVSTIAQKLTGIADNNELMAIVATVYKLFFAKVTPSTIVTAPAATLPSVNSDTPVIQTQSSTNEDTNQSTGT